MRLREHVRFVSTPLYHSSVAFTLDFQKSVLKYKIEEKKIINISRNWAIFYKYMQNKEKYAFIYIDYIQCSKMYNIRTH